VNYFVTGATGFIGRHLIEELLKRDGTIYALVREGSRGRLDEIAQRTGAGDRLVPVAGDLSKERLGIEGFDERIDHFFHLAAVYDIAADEEQMMRANVDGTRHVVEFANSIEVGMFHHTSSIAVAGRFRGLFREDMFDEDQELPHAYHRSKFESERVARSELRKPFRVYRPGLVVGHSETGVMDKIDGPYYVFKLIQKLRYALPQWFPLAGPEGRKLNLVPVDFVARALDHIAHMHDDDLYGNTFHLVDPDPLTAGQALNEFARAAHAPEFAMRVDSKMTNAIPKPVKAGLKAFPPIARARKTVLADLGIPESALENRDFLCDFDARDAQRALGGTGIAVPPLSAYAPKLWDYWERNLDPDLFRERSLAKAIDGKRILITGASSGIGREVALKVGEAGGNVMLVARTREKLEAVAREVEERGGTAHVHPADLSDTADIERMANEVVEQHGGVDVLVNNAGRSIRRSVKYQFDRFHDFERTMQLNYFGALRLILTFLQGMRERRNGHIINISSYSVQMNTPRFSAYAASKSALDQFSRCLAAEVVDKNINITTIYMPLVRTPMIAPTDFYRTLPALEPEEAGQLVCDAMIDKPKRVAKRLGTTAQVLYTLNPKVTDQIAHMVYRLFPEKDPKKKEAERRAREDGGEPETAEGQDQEISSEATALAYLMRGVYF
jgi:NAD(P)-dependent dehydrogenase (short-subunit alcohol dehydrogenase family)